MTSLDYFSTRLPHFLEDLRSLTSIETPSGDLPRLDHAAAHLRMLIGESAEVESERSADHGPLLRLRRSGVGARVLLVGHYDTVWPIGSWQELWRVEGGRAFGPGVYDMKGGVLFIVWLLRYLAEQGLEHPHIEAILNPDEEVGSPASRSAIEEAARRADVVLVLEPGTLRGDLKLARKGSGEYVVTIHGRASHQGASPELGVNSVVEAARQVLRLTELEDPVAGTTVGPNVINGGMASNIVPDYTELRVDVRAWTEPEMRRLDTAIRGLQPFHTGSRVHVLGGWNRPPMAVSDGSLELFEGARILGRTLGLDLEWVRWGGSSDANIAASVGAPTIDGFGPIGEGAHERDEYILIDEVPKRLALLAEVVRSLALMGREPIASRPA